MPMCSAGWSVAGVENAGAVSATGWVRAGTTCAVSDPAASSLAASRSSHTDSAVLTAMPAPRRVRRGHDRVDRAPAGTANARTVAIDDLAAERAPARSRRSAQRGYRDAIALAAADGTRHQLITVWPASPKASAPPAAMRPACCAPDSAAPRISRHVGSARRRRAPRHGGVRHHRRRRDRCHVGHPRRRPWNRRRHRRRRFRQHPLRQRRTIPPCSRPSTRRSNSSARPPFVPSSPRNGHRRLRCHCRSRSAIPRRRAELSRPDVYLP